MGGWSDDAQPNEPETCAVAEATSAPVQPQAAKRLLKVEQRLSTYADEVKQLASRLSDLHAEVGQITVEVGTAAAPCGTPRRPPVTKTPIMLDADAWSQPKSMSRVNSAEVHLPPAIPGAFCSRGPRLPTPDSPGFPQTELEVEDLTSCSDGGEICAEAAGQKRVRWASESKVETLPVEEPGVVGRRRVSMVMTLKNLRRQNSGALFADADEMKDKIRQQVTSKKEDATAFYSDTGIFQAVARSEVFESVCMIMICLNALWIAIEIDLNDAPMLFDSGPVFIVVANAFCVLFLAELIIRVLAFKDKMHALREFWVVFDMVLVLLMVVETWVISGFMALLGGGGSDATGNLKAFVVFRILRLLRVLRLARVLRELPELMVIVRAMAIAFRAISVVLILLGIIIYMGAIVFRVLLEDTSIGDDHFKTVPSAMGTLLLEMTLSGAKGGPLIRKASNDSIVFSAMMLLFVLLANVTVMGVLGGLLVQTVKTVAEMEKEERQVRSMAKMMDELWDIVVAKKSSQVDGTIHEGHLRSLLTDANAAKLLQKNGVDLEGLIDVSSFICEQSNGMLTKPQFKRMVLDLRGKNAAKVKDHVETRRFVSGMLKRAARGSILEG